MEGLYEYSNLLKTPIESFRIDSAIHPDFSIDAHWHYYAEFIYVEHGSCNVECSNNHVYTLGSGELLVVPPLVMHSIAVKPGSDTLLVGIKVSLSWINVSEGYLPRLDRYFLGIGNDDTIDLKLPQNTLPDFDLTGFFASLSDELHTREYGYDAIINAKVQEFIVKIVRNYNQHGVSPKLIDNGPESKYSVGDILAYIDSHSSDKLEVSSIADMCNMSYSYFAKSFRDMYGQSCSEYIESIRLNKAEKLLRFTDLDLAEISQETGFSDSSHLIKCFRKKYGITPHKFRKQ